MIFLSDVINKLCAEFEDLKPVYVSEQSLYYGFTFAERKHNTGLIGLKIRGLKICNTNFGINNGECILIFDLNQNIIYYYEEIKIMKTSHPVKDKDIYYQISGDFSIMKDLDKFKSENLLYKLCKMKINKTANEIIKASEEITKLNQNAGITYKLKKKKKAISKRQRALEKDFDD